MFLVKPHFQKIVSDPQRITRRADRSPEGEFHPQGSTDFVASDGDPLSIEIKLQIFGGNAFHLHNDPDLIALVKNVHQPFPVGQITLLSYRPATS